MSANLISLRISRDNHTVLDESKTVNVIYNFPNSESFEMEMEQYSMVLLVTGTNLPTNELPKHVPSKSTLLIAIVGENSSLMQIEKPLERRPPQMFIMATKQNYQQKWTNLQYEISPLLKMNMTGVTITLGVNTPAGMPFSYAVQMLSQSISALFWVMLRDHFKFSLAIKEIKLPPGMQSLNRIKSSTSEAEKGNVDFAADLMLVSSERASKLDFVLLGLDYKFHFMIRRPEYTYSWTGLIRPLQPSVWLSTLGIIVLASMAYFYTFDGRRSTRQTDLPTAVVTVFGFSCGQACLGRVKSLSAQIACITALFFSFIIQQFYFSNLYSIISTREIQFPFQSMEEFVTKKSHQLVINPETSVYTAFQAAKSGILKNIYDDFLRNDPTHVMNDTHMGDAVNRICSGTTAVFALPLQMLAYQKNCPMQAVPTGYFPNQMGLAARKGFPFLINFQSLFLRSSEGGLMNHFDRTFIKAAIRPILERGALTVDPLPVSLEQVVLLFVILIFFLGLSLVVLIFEFIHANRRLSHQVVVRPFII